MKAESTPSDHRRPRSLTDLLTEARANWLPSVDCLRPVLGPVPTLLLAHCWQMTTLAEGGQAWLTYGRIARKLGVNERTVMRACQTLQERGLVTFTHNEQRRRIDLDTSEEALTELLLSLVPRPEEDTPDKMSGTAEGPLTKSHGYPDKLSEIPLTKCQGTPDKMSPLSTTNHSNKTKEPPPPTVSPSATPAAGGGGGVSIRSEWSEQFLTFLSKVKWSWGCPELTSEEREQADRWFAREDKQGKEVLWWTMKLVLLAYAAQKRNWQDTTGGGEPYRFACLRSLVDLLGNWRGFDQKRRLNKARAEVSRLRAVFYSLPDYFNEDTLESVLQVAECSGFKGEDLEALGRTLRD